MHPSLKRPATNGGTYFDVVNDIILIDDIVDDYDVISRVKQLPEHTVYASKTNDKQLDRNKSTLMVLP